MTLERAREKKNDDVERRSEGRERDERETQSWKRLGYILENCPCT